MTDSSNKLERLIAEYLEAVESGNQPDRDSILQANPDVANDLSSFFANHDAFGLLHNEPNIAETTNPAQSSTIAHDDVPADTRVTPNDYEILKEIARGGMGVVYKARHRSLKRIVALKMIKSGEFAKQEQVDRFLKEAEAVAHLDHPGIVPVHEVGEVGGQHFFTMAYVDGDSLADRLKNGPLQPQKAASFALSIADAISYAHSKGVIHRDLKPANVLVTKDGVPRITDFGLAKRIEEDSELTSAGQVLGTPSYMPPEQAEGKLKEIGPAADIYAIGATMYCMLVGHPPFHAASVIETLQQVIEREPVSIRNLNHAVPADLDTLCLKCLEKKPTKRYESVGVLRDELSRFLSGEPIHARPISRLARSWRWCQRKPAIASLLGMLAIVSFSGLIAVLLAWKETVLAREDLAKRNKELTVAIDQSRSNFGRAELAIERFYTKVAQDKLFNVPGFIPLRRELLTDAVEFYEELMDQETGDAEVSNQTARAAIQLAAILHELERHDEGQAASRRALEIIQQLLEQHPDVPEYQETLASAYVSLATHRVPMAVPTQVLSGAGTSGTIRPSFPQPSPDEQVGPSYGDVETIVLFKKAITSRQELVRSFPENSDYRFGLAQCVNKLGSVLENLGRDAEAIEQYESAIEGFRAAFDLISTKKLALYHLAMSKSNMGNLHARNGDYDEAKQYFLDSLEDYRELPQSPQVMGSVANMRTNLGNCYQFGGQPKLAETEFLSAVEVFENLARDYPQVLDYTRDLGANYHNLGNLLSSLRRVEEAEKYYNKSREEKRTIATQLPSDVDAQSSLATTMMNLGSLYQFAGRFEEAAVSFREGIAVLDAVNSANLDDLASRRLRGSLFFNQGNLLMTSGDRIGARESWNKSQDVRQLLISENPDSSSIRRELAGSKNNLAMLILSSTDPKQDELEQAVTMATAATELAPDQDYVWNTLSNAQYRIGHWDSAIESAEKAMELSFSGSPWNWLILAMANHQLGRTEEAQKWFDRTERIRNQITSDDLVALFEEARQLIEPIMPREPE